MQQALATIASLPWTKLVDEWRWDVFSGQTAPEDYNKAWWELRIRYQGVAAPVPRSEQDFDPGAKFHIPANYSYTRYFLARILQFQFHRALCAAAGHEGPLHACSIYGSTEAGEKFAAMLAAGQSEPWQLTLEKLTGNACQAERKGVRIRHAGLCESEGQRNCPRIYQPVCARDGNTYSNACVMENAGERLAYAGACLGQ